MQFSQTNSSTGITGTVQEFQAASGQDTRRAKYNTFVVISTKLQNICGMEIYANKSMEVSFL
jgi:hypothetical protein